MDQSEGTLALFLSFVFRLQLVHHMYCQKFLFTFVCQTLALNMTKFN